MFVASKVKLTEHGNLKFSIRPFNLELSTEATTSHSNRKTAEHTSQAVDLDSPVENFNFEVDNIKKLCEKDDSPKIKPRLNDTQVKVAIEPIKIKVRYKNANLNKLKLKFNRNLPSSSSRDLNGTCPQVKEELVSMKPMVSNLNNCKQNNYMTQPQHLRRSTEKIQSLRPVDSKPGEGEKGALFKISGMLSTPRKTAYFGK
jgi:hypothetical protein